MITFLGSLILINFFLCLLRGFGRFRLRALARLGAITLGRLPQSARAPAIAVAQQDAVQAREFIEQLRAEGQCVVVDYGIESNASRDCSHRLVAQEGKWAVVKNA